MDQNQQWASGFEVTELCKVHFIALMELMNIHDEDWRKVKRIEATLQAKFGSWKLNVKVKEDVRNYGAYGEDDAKNACLDRKRG